MNEGDTFTAPESIYMNMGKRTFWLLFYERLSASFGFLLIGFGASMARRVPSLPGELYQPLAWLGIASWVAFLASLLYAVAASRLIYRANAFSFGADAFKLKRGVFTKIEMSVPYRQIQNVETERTLAQRFFGVSKLVIVTAGTDDPSTPRNEASCIVPTIDKEVAAGLQAELLRRADVQKVLHSR